MDWRSINTIASAVVRSKTYTHSLCLIYTIDLCGGRDGPGVLKKHRGRNIGEIEGIY